MAEPLTNEETAIKIQQGNTELYSLLWQRLERLIYKICCNSFNRLKERYTACGAELEDLIQVSFMALVKAVEYYNPNAKYKLTTYLTKTLQIEFNTLLGYRAYKSEPLNQCASLNTPIGEDNECELIDLQEDITASADFEAVEQKVYTERLRDDLEHSIDELPKEQGQCIRLKYFKGLSAKQISKLTGSEESKVKNNIRKAMTDLRRCNKHKRLIKYRNEIQSNYAYHNTGLTAFKYSGTSIEQRAVEKLDLIEQMILLN